MTDNRTTELREKLDERGIVWMDVYHPAIFRTCWKTGDSDVYCYFDEDKSTGLFELHISGYDFTLEQAIAATLGKEKAGKKSPPEGGPGPCGQPSDAIIHEVAALDGGKLTVEQVGEAIERNIAKLCVLDDGKPVEWREDWVCRIGIDYKAITDELNAAIGGGTCCIVNTDFASIAEWLRGDMG